MPKRTVGQAILPISIVAVVVLLWGQIDPSSSPFISEKIVECPLGAFQQNPLAGLSIQIQAGAISPYNRSVFFSLLREVGFAREAFPLRPQVKWVSREKAMGEERRSPGKESPMKLSLSGKVEGTVELNELLALLGKKIPFAGEMALPMPGRFLPAIRITQGTARVDLERVNDDRGMSFRGRIEISGGAVEIPRLNQRFSAVKGEISLEGNRIRVVSLTAENGGGLLEVQGDMEQERGRLTSLDLTFQGKGLRWQYPEGFSTGSDFFLHLRGEASQPQLVGRVELIRPRYVKEFDLKGLLLKLRKGEGSIPFRIRDNLDLLLDIELLTRDNLVFQSNLADLGLKARLRLTGSLKNPILLGRADLEEGKLKCLAQEFLMTQGRVEWIDPHRFRPYYEFEARGQVDKYRVKMVSYGTPQQFSLNLYSDPPLSPGDILSLLLVGRTSAETKAGSAYSLLLNRASQKLAQGIQKLTELDSLEIHAILGQAEGEKGFEILPKKALEEDITFSYKSGTGTNFDDQAIEMEYRLTDHISLVGKNSKSGSGSSGGFEIKFSFSWE